MCRYILGSQSVAHLFSITVTLSLSSFLSSRKMCQEHTVSHFSGSTFFDENAGIKFLWCFSYWHFICLMKSKKISKSLMRIILQRQRTFWQKCSCNLSVYIFYLRFALGINHGYRCDKKTHQQQLFYSSKTHFLIVEVSNTVTFWRNARFDVIFTSVPIIKQVSFAKCFVMSH